MQKPNSCQSCPLFSKGYSFSHPEGKGSLGVLGVGESLGREEAIDGLPFRPYAQSGSLLEWAIKKLGYSREQFALWNIIACQPPGNLLDGMYYEIGAINHCKRHFDKVIDKFQPRVILAFGALPTRVLTGLTGDKLNISDIRGYAFPDTRGYNCLVVPTYHPSYIRRGNAPFTEYLLADIKKAIKIAREGLEEYKPDFQLFPGEDEARSFLYRVRDNGRKLLTYDIEGPRISDLDESEKELGDYQITQIQFSLSEREGIAFPWQKPYSTYAKEILKLSNPKAGFNSWLFDDKVLMSKLKNDEEMGGNKIDLMWAFKHHYPELERGLQKVASLFEFPIAWKHLVNKSLQYYGCCDVDAPQWIARRLIPLMKENGIWECFKREYIEIRPILDKAEKRGLPINEESRRGLIGLLERQREEKLKEIQAAVPAEVRNLKFWAKGPKGLSEFIERYEEAAKGPNPPKKSLQWNVEHNFKFKVGEKEGVTGLKYGRVRVADKKNPGEEIEKEGWVWQMDFNPQSSEQIKEYIRYKQQEEIDRKVPASKRVWKVPTAIKKHPDTKEREEKETTGKDEIYRLAIDTGDKVLEGVRTFRSINKMLNNDIPNWNPWEDGKVHTTFSFSPPTGQLNSYGPNIQNCSKHTEYGQRFSRIIEAEEGRVFIVLDFSGFHVITMAQLAEDERYYFFGMNDIHSFFTSYLVRDKGERAIPLDIKDVGELRELTSYFKKKYPEIRQKRAKETILANQLGQQPRGLYLRHRHKNVYKSIKDAEWHQDLLNELFPRVKRFKDWIRRKAHEQGFLKNAFGRIQQFYDVYRWDAKRRCYTPGQDSERAIAFPVQSNAFGMMYEKLRESEKRGYNEKYSFVDTIHDSVIFNPYNSESDKCIAEVSELLTSPCMALSCGFCPKGLVVKVGIEMGRNWGKWDEKENREGMREVER